MERRVFASVAPGGRGKTRHVEDEATAVSAVQAHVQCEPHHLVSWEFAYLVLGGGQGTSSPPRHSPTIALRGSRFPLAALGPLPGAR